MNLRARITEFIRATNHLAIVQVDGGKPTQQQSQQIYDKKLKELQEACDAAEKKIKELTCWDLHTALEYIRKLQPAAMAAGWCIMLGGGVLNNGEGEDLDILAYPKTRDSKVGDLRNLLPKFELDSVEVADVYTYYVDHRRVELIVQTWGT